MNKAAKNALADARHDGAWRRDIQPLNQIRVPMVRTAVHAHGVADRRSRLGAKHHGVLKETM